MKPHSARTREDYYEDVVAKEPGCSCVTGAFTCPQCVEKMDRMMDSQFSRAQLADARAECKMAKLQRDEAVRMRDDAWRREELLIAETTRLKERIETLRKADFRARQLLIRSYYFIAAAGEAEIAAEVRKELWDTP